MVEPQPSKLAMPVRSRSPAPDLLPKLLNYLLTQLLHRCFGTSGNQITNASLILLMHVIRKQREQHREGGTKRFMKPAYFFLYPAGQVGFAPTTFLVVFPLTQVMMIVFDLFGFAGAEDLLAFGAGVVAAGVLGVEVGVAAGVGAMGFSCESLILIVGWEKWKL